VRCQAPLKDTLALLFIWGGHYSHFLFSVVTGTRDLSFINGMKDKCSYRNKRFVLHKRYEGQKTLQEQEICPS
jgi:hypothetical protein